MRLLALLVGLVLAGCGGSDGDFVLEGDESFGGFARDGTVAEAVERFGEPESRNGAGNRDRCTLRWPSLGLTMETFEASSPERACGPEGKHVSSTLRGERWETSEGLKIGDPTARLRELYPDAVQQGNLWWLTTRQFAGLAFPGLEARVANGNVVSFTVYGPKHGF